MYVGPWQEYRLAKLRSDAVNEIKEQFRHLQFAGADPSSGDLQLDTQRLMTLAPLLAALPVGRVFTSARSHPGEATRSKSAFVPGKSPPLSDRGRRDLQSAASTRAYTLRRGPRKTYSLAERAAAPPRRAVWQASQGGGRRRLSSRGSAASGMAGVKEGLPYDGTQGSTTYARHTPRSAMFGSDAGSPGSIASAMRVPGGVPAQEYVQAALAGHTDADLRAVQGLDSSLHRQRGHAVAAGRAQVGQRADGGTFLHSGRPRNTRQPRQPRSNGQHRKPKGKGKGKSAKDAKSAAQEHRERLERMRRMYGMQAEGGNGGTTGADATGAGNPAMGGQHGSDSLVAGGQAAAQSAVGVHPAMAPPAGTMQPPSQDLPPGMTATERQLMNVITEQAKKHQALTAQLQAQAQAQAAMQQQLNSLATTGRATSDGLGATGTSHAPLTTVVHHGAPMPGGAYQPYASQGYHLPPQAYPPAQHPVAYPTAPFPQPSPPHSHAGHHAVASQPLPTTQPVPVGQPPFQQAPQQQQQQQQLPHQQQHHSVQTYHAGPTRGDGYEVVGQGTVFYGAPPSGSQTQPASQASLPPHHTESSPVPAGAMAHAPVASPSAHPPVPVTTVETVLQEQGHPLVSPRPYDPTVGQGAHGQGGWPATAAAPQASTSPQVTATMQSFMRSTSPIDVDAPTDATSVALPSSGTAARVQDAPAVGVDRLMKVFGMTDDPPRVPRPHASSAAAVSSAATTTHAATSGGAVQAVAVPSRPPRAPTSTAPTPAAATTAAAPVNVAFTRGWSPTPGGSGAASQGGDDDDDDLLLGMDDMDDGMDDLLGWTKSLNNLSPG